MHVICETCDRECKRSFVYIMTGRGDGCVKVGYAADAKQRAAQLRRATGLPIQLHKRYRVSCEFQAWEAEDIAHELLAQYWSGKGEWFRCPEWVAEAAIERAIRETRR